MNNHTISARWAIFLMAPLMFAGCGGSKPAPVTTSADTPSKPSERPASTIAPSEEGEFVKMAPSKEELIPLSAVKGISPGAECPDPGAGVKAVMAAAAEAQVPLKVGLTLSSVWKVSRDDYEHECLAQVTQIDDRGIVSTNSCPAGDDHKTVTSTRRTCWKDVMDSYVYIPSFAKSYPETLVGALEYNASLASFQALKSGNPMRHRLIGLRGDEAVSVAYDIEGNIKTDGPGTFKLIINDKAVGVPVIEASYFGGRDGIRVKILDDARFPMMIDYFVPSLKRYFVTYTKVSFPTVNEVEKHLAVDRRTDVYGIYFNFASDELRPESEPVLNEIAAALRAHPDWKLTINGHTDDVGGDASNLELSRRRAAAVRSALSERFHIDASRLMTQGFGASQPKEPNDTDAGRALNRRVELVRQ